MFSIAFREIDVAAERRICTQKTVHAVIQNGVKTVVDTVDCSQPATMCATITGDSVWSGVVCDKNEIVHEYMCADHARRYLNGTGNEIIRFE